MAGAERRRSAGRSRRPAPGAVPTTTITSSTPGHARSCRVRRSGTRTRAETAGSRGSGTPSAICEREAARDRPRRSSWKRRPHREQRDDRERVRTRRRRGTARRGPRPKSAPPSGGPPRLYRRRHGPAARPRPPAAAARVHDRAQRPGRGGGEERRRPSPPGRRRPGSPRTPARPPEDRGAPGSAIASARDAVGARSSAACGSSGRRQRPRASPKSAVRDEPRERDHAGLRRRVRHREHEQRIGDASSTPCRRSRAAARSADRTKSAVAAQRALDIDRRTLPVTSVRSVSA